MAVHRKHPSRASRRLAKIQYLQSRLSYNEQLTYTTEPLQKANRHENHLTRQENHFTPKSLTSQKITSRDDHCTEMKIASYTCISLPIKSLHMKSPHKNKSLYRHKNQFTKLKLWSSRTPSNCSTKRWQSGSHWRKSATVFHVVLVYIPLFFKKELQIISDETAVVMQGDKLFTTFELLNLTF